MNAMHGVVHENRVKIISIKYQFQITWAPSKLLHVLKTVGGVVGERIR